jgi:hypothetical protein
MKSASISFRRLPGLPAVGVVAALAVLALTGCGKDKTTQPNPGGGSTTYTGSVTGKTTSGKLTITVATSTPAPQPGPNRAKAIVTASGTFTPSGGAAISLTGNYDDQANMVGVTGSGWTFTGGATATDIEGTFTGPTPAPNTESGVFNLQSGSSEVTVIIGTFTSTNGGDNGRFNFSIKGSAVHGNAWEETGTIAIPLDGTYDPNGTPFQISIVNPADPGGPPAAQGTYDTGTGVATGTFTAGTNTGTWTGNKVN